MVVEFRANLNLVNKRLAEESHKGTSFDPEKRAVQEIEGFGQYVNEVYDNLKKYAKTEAQQEYLNSEMDRFQHGFASKYNDHLSAEGRTISSFITGGSNFPVRRAQKANVAEQNRYEEMIEYRNKAQAAILRELKKMAVEEAGGEIEVLKKKIERAEQTQEAMKTVNAIIRKKTTTEEKVKEIIEKTGFREETVRKMFVPDYMGRIGFPAFELTNNNANIRRMKDRIIELEKKEATPTGEIAFTGGYISDNREEDRVQIFFDQKPPQAMIDKLKSEGWRWAPSVGAWSRKRTDMALYSASRITGAALPTTPATAPPAPPVAIPPISLQPPIITPPLPTEEVHARLQKVIDIIKIYRDKGLTYEDLLAGLKGYYLEQSGYVMGSNLNAQKLTDDLKKSGYNNLRELWRKIIVQSPEIKATVPSKIPLLYPALQQQEVNPINIINYAGFLSLTIGNEEYKIGALNAKSFIETTYFYDVLYHSPYKAVVPQGNMEYNKILEYFKINSKKQLLISSDFDRTLKAYSEGRGYELTLQDYIWADKYTIRGKVRHIKGSEAEKQRRVEYALKNYNEEIGKKLHRMSVISARERGIKVSDEVLKDYPDLTKKELPIVPPPPRPAEEIMIVPNPETLTKDEYVKEKYKRLAQVLRQQGKNAIAERVEKGAREPETTFKYETSHRDQVVLALEQGKTVSPLVLKDYPDLIKKELQPTKDKFAEIQEQMQRDKEKISGEHLQERAWQMTSNEFINESLKINRYRESYEKDPNLMNQFTNSGIQKWKELVEKHGEVGKLPDKVIENYIQLFGEKALFSVFRGTKEKGIEGWRISVEAPHQPPVVKPLPAPAPSPSPINIFEQTTQRIRIARTLEELQTVRNEINTLPLFANERVKILELYNARYSLLLSEKPFGIQTQLPATKPVFIGGLTPQEQRRKAQQKLTTPPTRRLSEFGIKERAQRYYPLQRRYYG